VKISFAFQFIKFVVNNLPVTNVMRISFSLLVDIRVMHCERLKGQIPKDKNVSN
jgi:hypothetical protein